MSEAGETFSDLQRRGQQWASDIAEDCKNQPPKEWAIFYGISFMLILAFVLATRAKDEPVFSVGLFMVSIVITMAAVIIRKLPLTQQYPLVVTLLTVTRLFTEIHPFNVLAYAAVPIFVNYIRKEFIRK